MAPLFRNLHSIYQPRVGQRARDYVTLNPAAGERQVSHLPRVPIAETTAARRPWLDSLVVGVRADAAAAVFDLQQVVDGSCCGFTFTDTGKDEQAQRQRRFFALQA